jgi:hypothetical protein
LVAVNETGMWSTNILEKYVEEILLKRPQTSLLKEPVLLIIDSYGPHINLAKSKKLEKQNIFIELIPPNMTGILQPLDVAVNKSFQEAFGSSYDIYIAEAIKNPDMQTKQGNPKVPNYETVSNWVVEWANAFESSKIIKAFTTCGIGTKESFAVENLHAPLREILDHFDMIDFLEKYSNNFQSENYFTTISECDWFWPQKVSTSIFECVHKAKSDSGVFEKFVESYVGNVINVAKDKYADVFDANDEAAVTKGYASGTEVELCIISKLELWRIVRTEVDENCEKIDETVFDCEDSSKTIELVKLNGFYGLKI